MLFDLIGFGKYKENRPFKIVAGLAIIAMIILFRFIIYLSGGTTAFVHIMYIPILSSVFILGIKAGIAASIIAGILLGPSMPFVVSQGIMQDTKSWVFRIFMFITIVLVVGILLEYIKRMHEREKEKAYIDVITGYPNTNKFVEDLNFMINEGRFNTLSIIVFEYKNMEMINQYVNHEVGKKSFINLLKHADKHFKHCNIYTISTNKFIIIIPETDCSRANHMANKFEEKTRKPMFVDTLPISLIVRGGIVNYPMHGNHINEITSKLEKVMTQSVKTQKIITIYDNIIEAERMKYYDTLVSLYFSLQNDMFYLVYQPKIKIDTNEIVGTEALLRIKNDEYSNISISQLIEMAEEVGFINEITKWVITNSILQIKKWKESGIHTKVSVNLSSIDLNDESIIDFTIDCLDENHIDSSLIEFELTERSIIEDVERALFVLKKMREKGIKISLDDYGSGHNSLSHLMKSSNQFDYIKIDKIFIDNIDEKQNEVLVEGIINTAHTLGMEVVAEGVETEVQVEILRKIGCDIIQGYFYSKPLPPEEFLNHKKITQCQ
ncbi:EAL domain-containing protein [Sedimentibacter hydroxybenzoicus DSM 7310]|uniref:EAL domain-containing protein n=1 Tax=Sedimentibacter hydroxybenzoicus DSM 7310 TaxID=1123245 RepID=A0A974BHL1_SEDHY|nr:GGDEF domain-containing phosphodiesterase [Sedimentibacter hydroxybenzoicus]NYB73324.1 EAL domain-containing protein [Sedimentibacter hydroxybenzoicus DSM 7310]